MKKKKVMTILGTRPEIIRLSEVIKLMDIYFDHIVVHTGQNWDKNLSTVFFQDLDLRLPDIQLNCVGENLGVTIGKIISETYNVILENKPEAILILGDTNSSLAAISAKRLKVPIFHMEAGNRCWDWNVSEMINRKIVDSISDINLPYTENSRRYLISEGVDGKTIFVTGSPMLEVLNVHKHKVLSSNILQELGLIKGEYILLSSHREENMDNEFNFYKIVDSINAISTHFNKKIVFSVHPRSNLMLKKRGVKFNEKIILHEPFGFIDFIKLQLESFCVVSDSGTLSEESAILNFPAVLLRTSTERPEAIDFGSIVIGGLDKEGLIQSIETSIKLTNDSEHKIPTDYLNHKVSNNIVKVIQSYSSIVDMTVWRK
jgi:UDP-N-acetyl-L-fucosamine synthase